MKRFIILITTLVLICTLASCGRSTSSSTTEPSQPTTQEPSTTTGDNTTSQHSDDDELMNKTLSLKIGNIEVDVNWLDNDSVTALKKLAKDGLSIEMHMYGGFEQVGSLGTSIT